MNPDHQKPSHNDDRRVKVLKEYLNKLWNWLREFISFRHLFTACAAFILSRFIFGWSTSNGSSARREEMKQLYEGLEQTQLAVQTLSQRLNTQRQINAASARHNSQLQFSLNATEESLKRATDHIEQLQSEITQLQEQLSQCRERIYEQSNENKELQNQLDDRFNQIQSLNDQLDQTQHRVRTLEDNARLLQEELHEKEKQLHIALETQRVFEYVLSKGSPDLAKAVVEQLKLIRSQTDAESSNRSDSSSHDDNTSGSSSNNNNNGNNNESSIV